MLRDSYILDTLECGDFSFATACLLANRKYGKNTQHGDIKSHQYIISFDPRDAADNGLTMEKAQALGLKFCSENFPGHPAIVCTHPDGHNHSGNIHVHIVIGSVRTREVERKPYMQKPRDWLEGMKHSSTAQTMRHLRVEVMELCEDAGLYQIDLLNGSKERVSEAEYWARRRGQQKLDLANAALAAAGQQPKQKKFETVKDTLRKQISSVLYRATSFEDFSDKLMQQYGIAVKESRGQLSYLPAGRTKFIRARHLGDKFDKAAVLATLQANAERKPKAQFKQDTIGKLIDIQSRMTEGKGIGYKRWLTKHNLKVMAQTVKLLQEKGLTDEDALNQRIAELETKYHDALAVVKDLEGRMKFNKELGQLCFQLFPRFLFCKHPFYLQLSIGDSRRVRLAGVSGQCIDRRFRVYLRRGGLCFVLGGAEAAPLCAEVLRREDYAAVNAYFHHRPNLLYIL